MTRRDALPRGHSGLDQACSVGGHLYAVSERTAFRWSPEAEWEQAPDPRGPLRVLGPVEGGTLFRAGEAVGLWPHAVAAWAWWQTIPSLREAHLADERTLVVACNQGSSSLAAYTPDPGGLRRTVELPLEDPRAPRLAGACRSSEGHLLVLTSMGLLRVNEGTGEAKAVGHLPERWRPAGGGFTAGGFFVASGGPSGPAAAFSRGGYYITILPLPGPENGVLQSLLRAYVAKDKTRARQLLGVLGSVSAAKSGAMPLDFVWEGQAPAAVATSAGLAWPDPEGGTEQPSLRFDTMPWRLWLDPEAALPDALSRYLGAPEQDVLGEALAQCRDDRLPTLAVESVRGRSGPFDAGHVQALFGRLGHGAAPEVLRATADDDTAVALLGTLAAATERVARRLGGPDLKPAFEESLRRLLQEGCPRLRTAALEVLARFPRRGFAEALAGALTDGDPVVRSTALRAVGAAPDRSLVVPAVAAAVQRETREDERRAGLRVLGDLSGPVADRGLVDATADVSGPVRAEAALQLRSRAPRLSTPAAYEVLDRVILLAVATAEARRRRLAANELSEGLPAMWAAARLALARIFDGGDGASALFALDRVASRLFPEDLAQVDSEEQGFRREDIETAAGSILKREDIDRLEDGTFTPPAWLLAELADRVQSVDTALADRFAVLTLIGVGSRPPAGDRGLTARLRATQPTSLVDFCRSWTHALADEPSPSSLGSLAAYVLAVRGAAAEQRCFERRLFDGDLPRWPMIALGWAAHLGRGPTPAFARKIAGERRWSAARRRLIIEGLRRLLGLDDDSWSALQDTLAAESTGGGVP